MAQDQTGRALQRSSVSRRAGAPQRCAARWAVLDQALSIARREGGRVHGVHIVADEADLGNPAQETLRQEFGRRCAAAQVEGSFNLEVGVLSDKVRAMAALTDLVVIGLDATGHTLSPEVMAWMRYCTRPILTVPQIASEFRHALLAYDGSPKSKEALFVAAYLGETWQTRLTLITVNDPGRASTARCWTMRASIWNCMNWRRTTWWAVATRRN